MPDFFRDAPAEMHGALEAEAARNRRGLNRGIMLRLAESLARDSRDTAPILKRIRRLKRAIGPIDIDRDSPQSLRETGRR